MGMLYTWGEGNLCAFSQYYNESKIAVKNKVRFKKKKKKNVLRKTCF